MTVSYTPNGKLLNQTEWCSSLTDHAADTDAALVHSCARDLVKVLNPVRLALKLERLGEAGETLQYTYSYARPKAPVKRPRAQSEPSDSDD